MYPFSTLRASQPSCLPIFMCSKWSYLFHVSCFIFHKYPVPATQSGKQIGRYSTPVNSSEHLIFFLEGGYIALTIIYIIFRVMTLKKKSLYSAHFFFSFCWTKYNLWVWIIKKSISAQCWALPYAQVLEWMTLPTWRDR